MMTFQYTHKLGSDISSQGTYSEKDVPSDIVEIIRTNDQFSESKEFGQKGLGDPEEYELLVVKDAYNKKQFEYYNKGIHYMMSSSKSDKPVFQVFAHFMSTK